MNKKKLFFKIAFIVSLSVIAISFIGHPIATTNLFTGIGALISAGVFFTHIIQNEEK